MIGSIIVTVFTIFCAIWVLLSALTIFLMVKYNGISLVVWVIIALYCIITIPILFSGYSTIFHTTIDWESFLPRLFIH